MGYCVINTVQQARYTIATVHGCLEGSAIVLATLKQMVPLVTGPKGTAVYTLLLFSPRAERKYPYLSAWKTSFCGLTSPYNREGERDRARETERETDRQRETDRETDTETVTERGRGRDNKKNTNEPYHNAFHIIQRTACQLSAYQNSAKAYTLGTNKHVCVLSVGQAKSMACVCIELWY